MIKPLAAIKIIFFSTYVVKFIDKINIKYQCKVSDTEIALRFIIYFITL